MKFSTKNLFLLMVSIILAFVSCTNQPDVIVKTENATGFNIPAFANLVKTTTDPQALENAINADGNNINNMDLDNNGKIDYLSVQETNGQIQVIDVSSNSEVVATLSVTSLNNQANVQIMGNQTYCGSDYSYHVTLGDLLLLHYLTHPHVYYHSIYHRGYYPTTYTYHTRSVVTRTRTVYRNDPSRTYVPQQKTYDRKSLSNPTSSQRSFQVRDNKPVSGGGFGKSSGGGFGGSSKPSGGFGGNRSFGSGRSSFGRRH